MLPGDDSYSRRVEEGRPLRGECARSHPENKTLLGQETVLLGPRNPLQKAPLAKDDENLLTPPEVTVNPPQG